MCGDNPARGLATWAILGSPPRVRGLPPPKPRAFHRTRITPACAGTTLFHDAVDLFAEDHPRVCGDYFHTYAPDMVKLGSPPRVRGLLRLKRNGFVCLGITPACAGTTLICMEYNTLDANHPRVCGDYPLELLRHASGRGSPPRVRGLQAHDALEHGQDGITPACAGTTAARSA